jgi:predicted alpha/beta-fold hydrolase
MVRLDTPDGDFLDVVRLDAPASAPRLFLLHGLEGTERSHYVAGFLNQASRRGWGVDVLLFRGCGAEPNRASRFYHSGETTDLEFALAHTLSEFADAPILLAGVSLGGNVLLKWLGERGATLPHRIAAAAAISVPFDLERGCRRIGTGFSRVYERHFMQSLRRKALAKLERFPGLFDATQARRASSLYDFDDAVTAPVHGFRDAHDYYSRSSALGYLDRIRLPTLLLSAVDDPFLPPAVLDDVREIVKHNAAIEIEFPPHGGHVGFIAGRNPWRPHYYAEWRAVNFLARALA